MFREHPLLLKQLKITCFSTGGDNSMVERRVSDRKVVDSRLDSPTGDASLGKKLYAYFPYGPSSLPAVVSQPEETLAVEPRNGVLCWCG